MTPTPGKTAIAESSRSKDKPRALIEEMFAKADVRIDGSRPFDIQVRDNRFYRRVLSNPALGIGESYMDGWWECEDIVEMVARFIRANLHKPSAADLKFVAYFLWIQLSGLGKRSKAFEVGQAHYDLGNDLFEAMLDKRMIYSCAYWKDAVTLEQAQENKLDLICRKIALKPGMKVLRSVAAGEDGPNSQPRDMASKLSGSPFRKSSRRTHRRAAPACLSNSVCRITATRPGNTIAWFRSPCSKRSVTNTTGPLWRW